MMLRVRVCHADAHSLLRDPDTSLMLTARQTSSRFNGRGTVAEHATQIAQKERLLYVVLGRYADLQGLASNPGLLRPLTASQVHQVQLTGGGAFFAFSKHADLHVNGEHCVGS